MINYKGGNHLGDLSIDVGIVLKWILEKRGMRMWTTFIRLRIGTSGTLLL
jgi:hypothetical protein